MTKLLSVLLTIVISTAAFASNEPASQPVLTGIQEGNWKVAGSFDFTYGDTHKGAFTVSPSAEYFATDRFSIGGLGSWGHAFGQPYNTWSIGPSATFYFWKRERLVAYVGQALTYSGLSASGPDALYFQALTSVTKLGVEYFVSPSVSFGPALQWRHIFDDLAEDSRLPSRNSYSFVGQFSVFF